MRMKCPYCFYQESKVVDSRPADDGERIRRRRECLKCQKRFTTYEIIETTPLMVIKRDRSRESFNREKILAGLLRACQKRPIPTARLEEIVGDIEIALQNRLEHEVDSQVIGEMVLERLKPVDEIAYVRFASVYRQFKDINTFLEELNRLVQSRDAFGSQS